MAVVVVIAIIGILANLFLPEPPTRKDEAAEAKAAAWVSDPNDPNNVKIEAAIRKELKNLTWLDLHDTKITDAGLKELAKEDLEKVTSLCISTENN